MGKSAKGSRPTSAHAWGDEDQGKTGSAGSGRTHTPVEVVKDLDSASLSQKSLVVDRKPGPMSKVGRFVRSFWATRMTEDVEEDKVKYVTTTLRELIVYIVFLTVLCIITFGMAGATQYYYTKVLNELFLDSDFDDDGTTFKDMGSIGDFWNYAESSLLDGLYWETWYNDQNVTEDQTGFIFYENKLLGVPRMRMLKVKNDSCNVADTFKEYIPLCFDTYSVGIEDRLPFGPHDTSTISGWKYKTSGELDGSNHYGKLTYYGGGGFVQDLGTTRAKTQVILDELKQEMWLGRGTRAVFIDFTVYNANINLFCFIRLVVEIPASGGTITSWDFRTVKLLRYVTPMDFFVLAMEGVFALFIIYYIIEEAIEIKKHKMQYLKTFWNIVDITVIVLAIFCVAFNIYRSLDVSAKLEQLLQDPEIYPDFEWLSFWQVLFNCTMAVMTFLAWAKLFKYLSFNKTMTQLSTTLSASAKDLAGFGIMFTIVFFAFAQLGHLLFGSVIKDFSSVPSCIYTLFRIILGDFDFAEIEQADRILGPTYFIIYVFFVFFILLNMFLAIINDTYSEVKADLASKENEFEIGDFLKEQALKAMGKIKSQRKSIQKARNALKKADRNDDKVIDFNEWRENLRGQGYEENQIDTMFQKYDSDGNHFLDENEQIKMEEDLKNQDKKLEKDYKKAKGKLNDLSDESEAEEEGMHKPKKRYLTKPDFAELERRVDNMELSIGGIVDKIDTVLVKLESMERAKAKRREAMANILNIIAEADGGSDKEKRQNMEELVRSELNNWEKESSA